MSFASKRMHGWACRFFDDLAGVRVFDLHKKKGFIDVKASGLTAALVGPCPDLGGAGVVVDPGVPCGFHSTFGGGDVGPRFAGAGDLADAQARRVDPHFAGGGFGHAQHVGGGGHHGGGLQFLDFENTGLGVEHPSGDHLTPDLLRRIVAGPEGDKNVVAKRDKHPVGRPVSLGPEDVRPALGPPLPVLPGVGLVDGLAGGAARLPEFAYILQRDAQRVAVRERVLSLDIPHHRLFHLRHPPDVFKRTNVGRTDPGRIVKASVKPGPLVGPGKNPLELGQLQLAQPLGV